MQQMGARLPRESYKIDGGNLTEAIDSNPDPGWYPDPQGGDGERLWDGTKWTNQVRTIGNSTSATAFGAARGSNAIGPPESSKAKSRNVSMIAVLASCGLAAVSIFLPWATFTSGLLGTQSEVGTAWDGKYLVIPVGLAVLLMVPWPKHPGLVRSALAATILGLSCWAAVTDARFIDQYWQVRPGISISPGFGLYMFIAGSGIGAFYGLARVLDLAPFAIGRALGSSSRANQLRLRSVHWWGQASRPKRWLAGLGGFVGFIIVGNIWNVLFGR